MLLTSHINPSELLYLTPHRSLICLAPYVVITMFCVEDLGGDFFPRCIFRQEDVLTQAKSTLNLPIEFILLRIFLSYFTSSTYKRRKYSKTKAYISQ